MHDVNITLYLIIAVLLVMVGVKFYVDKKRNPVKEPAEPIVNQDTGVPSDHQLIFEADLREALDRGEFHLCYQPNMDLATGKIIGAEALIRWKHSKKGDICPGEFLSLAEDTGLIIPIGEWVLRTACMQTKAWQDAGLPPIIMSVNLSVRQLYQHNLVEMIQLILTETGLNPGFLELEITENMMIESDQVLHILRELGNIGIRISMDDFGTGYSSLHRLKDFPIHKLKIDQTFIQNCAEDPSDAMIVNTIIAMARELRLEVVAEGVETQKQLVFLQQNLCDQAQGYLFSQPLDPEQFSDRFDDIEQVIPRLGIPQDSSNPWIEEALKLARQELLDMVRQQQGMIYKFVCINGKFIHTFIEGELLHRMGLVPEQVVGKDLFELLPESIAERKVHYYLRAWNGEENVIFEDELRGLHYLATMRPVIRGGRVVEVIVSCVDITERIKIEEALRVSEQNYRLIAENMSDLIGVMDVNAVYQYVSPSYEKKLGYSPELIEGQQIFDLVHPEDVLHCQNEFVHMLFSKEPKTVECRIRHMNGEWMVFEARCNPVLDDKEIVQYVVIVSTDISERKRAEELIRKSEKLSAVGQLAAGVAHEIRNPLTSIKGFVQLMQHDGTINPKYIEIVLSEINRIEEIIQEFLTLAKPQITKLIAHDPNELIEHVMTLFRSQAILMNIEIVEEFSLDLPAIYCDGNQIKQVFVNILQNAFESMPKGGIVTVQTLRHDAYHCSFRVIDQGPGIPEERLKRLGEPFYSTKEKGTGLGLMISHKIVQEHGGTLRIESAVGKGTTVEVILPLRKHLKGMVGT